MNEKLIAAAKAAVAYFCRPREGRPEGFPPADISRLDPAALAKAAGIEQPEAEIVFSAWTTVVRPEDEFGKDFSLRLLAEMEKLAAPPAATTTTDPLVTAAPNGEAEAPGSGGFTPPAGLTVTDLARAYLQRAASSRGISPHGPALEGKARKAGQHMRFRDEGSLSRWCEGQVSWLDAKAVVAEKAATLSVKLTEDQERSLTALVSKMEAEVTDEGFKTLVRIVTSSS